MAILSFNVPRGALQNIERQYADKAARLGVSGPAKLRVDNATNTIKVHVFDRTAAEFTHAPAKLGELYTRPSGRAQLLHYLSLATS